MSETVKILVDREAGEYVERVVSDEDFHALARRRFALCSRRLPAGMCMMMLGHAGECDASGENLPWWVTQADVVRLMKSKARRLGARGIVVGIARWFKTRRRHIVSALIAGILMPTFWGRAILIITLIDLYHLEEERRWAKKKHVCQTCERCGHPQCHPGGPYR